MDIHIQYGTSQNSIGNIYKFWGEWKSVLCVLFKEWESCPNHPAQLHYGLDFNGHNLNEAINKTAYEAFALCINSFAGKATVLDAGCGIGGASFVLAKNNKACSFVGITPVAAQKEIATQRAKKHALSNITYIVGDYRKTAFHSHSFDGIIGIETFVYIPPSEKYALFCELFRLLKPGGRIVIYDGFFAEGDYTTFKNYTRYAQISDGWAIPPIISTANQCISAAKKAGFTLIMSENITQRILHSAKEIKSRAILFSLPIHLFSWLAKRGMHIPFLARIGFHKTESLQFQQTCFLQYQLFTNREIEYYRIVLQKPKKV